MARLTRLVPRPFRMHWGHGNVVEEASYLGRYHEPALQLMEFEDGSWAIRFCYYSRGRFQRSPLMIDAKELKAMKTALRRTPKLRKLLRGLVA